LLTHPEEVADGISDLSDLVRSPERG